MDMTRLSERLSQISFPSKWSAVAWDTARAAEYVQQQAEMFFDLGGMAMSILAKSVSLPFSATDYQALAATVRKAA